MIIKLGIPDLEASARYGKPLAGHQFCIDAQRGGPDMEIRWMATDSMLTHKEELTWKSVGWPPILC
jgi:hypothetical protein